MHLVYVLSFLFIVLTCFWHFFSFKCQGVARRLLKTALNAAAKKRQMGYDELKKIDKGDRRFYHDDITVVVIFINHELLGKKISVPELSVRGFVDAVGPSNFNILQNWCITWASIWNTARSPEMVSWVVKIGFKKFLLLRCFCSTWLLFLSVSLFPNLLLPSYL